MNFSKWIRLLIGMPPILLIVELFLAYSIIRNLNVFAFACFLMEPEFEPMVKALITVSMAMLSSVFLVNTMFGLPSASRYSWRSAVRTLVFLLLASWSYELIGTSYFNIMPLTEMLILSVVAILILMLPQVRAYYVPPMIEMPPLKWWIKFCFLKPKEYLYEYKFTYNDN
jgi:hypothetical protein